MVLDILIWLILMEHLDNPSDYANTEGDSPYGSLIVSNDRDMNILLNLRVGVLELFFLQYRYSN